MNQAGKAAHLRELHRGPTFVIANAWSIGSAKRLESLGFKAIATTSGGLALDIGLKDGEVGADATLANAGTIAQAVDVPVSADLENGFGDRPEDCVATVMRAIGLGLAGGSIEDSTGRPNDPVYPLDIAVQRVRALRAGIAKPVNVLIGYDKAGLGVKDLAAERINRVSVGSGLIRAAFRGMEEAAHHLLQDQQP